jgi:hypothetical protein
LTQLHDDAKPFAGGFEAHTIKPLWKKHIHYTSSTISTRIIVRPRLLDLVNHHLDLVL